MSASALVRLVQADALTRRYTHPAACWRRPTVHTALDMVSLHVDAGEAVGIVGESGSGKSTLARLLLGLDKPSAGSVQLAGHPVASLPRKRIAQIVQPVFQDPYGSLNPSYTVERLLALPLRLRARRGDTVDIAAQTTRLLDQVGLPARVRGAYPHALSGGQRQRVAIARALAVQPQLLICDEPTSALDVSVQAQILNLLQDLRQELGLALLLISHNLGVVGHMVDRLYVLQQGKVVEAGSTAQVFDTPRHPYPQRLFASVL
nr:ABC transporter ATP-binding protein [uncultured Achromobacter sp.]